MTDKHVGLMQLDLEGNQISGKFPDVEFDCPLCGKHIVVKRDKKGDYEHRSWMFHFMYDHVNKSKNRWKKVKDHMGVWLYYFAFHDQPSAKELVNEWNEKVEVS